MTNKLDDHNLVDINLNRPMILKKCAFLMWHNRHCGKEEDHREICKISEQTILINGLLC